MTLTPRLHKLSLAAHVTFSVGWLGAVAAFLALAVAGLLNRDSQTVRAAYLAMEVTTWFVIVPLAVASLVSGLVVSLGTAWGLFRHYWVVAKLVITVLSTVLLLAHTQPIGFLADVARETTLSGADVGRLQAQLVGDAGLALLALVVNVMLSVFKPWGMTQYGLRSHRERRRVSMADRPTRLQGDMTARLDSTAAPPRWVYIVAFHAVGLALVFLVVHLVGGGAGSH
jgi:hypothetical protein